MDYVIVGNGVASIGAIEGIRRYDAAGDITVVSRERFPTYGRPLISYYLAGKIGEEQMTLRSPAFYEKNRVRQILGMPVQRLDTAGAAIHLESCEKLAYGKLLLATGSSAAVLPVPGREGPDVYPFTTLEHARNLAAAAREGARAVIIGAGLIALKAAEGLAACGVHVTLVVRSRIMRAYFDQTAGELLVAHLESKGVRFMQGAATQRIVRDASGKVRTVETDKGAVGADFVVMAVGVSPDIGLAKGGGLRTNKGIVVDTCLRTSAENVYAAGDVAETLDLLSGGHSVTPIWPNAYQQGHVAGKNMAGAGIEYKGSLPMNSIAYFGLPTASVGVVNPPEDQDYEIFTEMDQKAPTYRKLVFKGAQLVGYVLVGNIDLAGRYSGFVRFQVPLDATAKARLKDGNPTSLLWPREFFDSRWNPELEEAAP